MAAPTGRWTRRCTGRGDVAADLHYSSGMYEAAKTAPRRHLRADSPRRTTTDSRAGMVPSRHPGCVRRAGSSRGAASPPTRPTSRRSPTRRSSRRRGRTKEARRPGSARGTPTSRPPRSRCRSTRRPGHQAYAHRDFLASRTAAGQQGPRRRAHHEIRKAVVFFRRRATSSVIELGAGGGLYTELLAPLIANKGTSTASADPTAAWVGKVKTVTRGGTALDLFLAKSPALFGQGPSASASSAADPRCARPL